MFEYALDPAEGQDFRRELFDRLSARKWPLMGMKSMEMTLEEIFIALTRETIPTVPRNPKKGVKRNERRIQTGIQNLFYLSNRVFRIGDDVLFRRLLLLCGQYGPEKHRPDDGVFQPLFHRHASGPAHSDHAADE